MKKVGSIQGQVADRSKKMEIMRENQQEILEIRNTVTERMPLMDPQVGWALPGKE